MAIRSRLVLLVLAVLVPAVLASLTGMAYVYRERERSVEKSLMEMSRALALVVDREINRKEGVLTLLSLSPALTEGEMERFSGLIRSAAAATGSEIFYYDPSGRPLLGSSDFKAARIPDSALEDALRQPDDVVVSNVYTAESGTPSFALIRPAVVDGAVVGKIAMIAPISHFQDLLGHLKLPRRWIGVIVDPNGVITARSRNPHLHVGTKANADVLERLRSGREGFFHSVTRDGTPTLAAFNKAPGSDWAFIAGIPEEDINRSASDAMRLLAILAIVLIAGGLLLSVRAGRSIVASMRKLAAKAEALGRGDPVPADHTGLQEADAVATAMAAASERLQDANRIMERRVADAVADSKRTQAALLQSQKLEALGRLTGGIAHDFNNLLQTLSTGLHVASMQAKEEAVASTLETCKRAVGRAAKLTRQLMTFGKSHVSEAKRMDVRNQLLAMEDLFKGALRGNISLQFDLAEDLWPVHVDPLQFELALLNLAINARDATPGSGSVRIAAGNLEVGPDHPAGLAPGDYVRLAFSDSGEGMTAEVRDKALDPFFTTKAAGKGSGLGLAQVYGFVKQANGGLSLDSAPDEGTTVSLFLPRAGSADPAGDRPQVPESPAVARDATVLMIEDDVLVRDVVGPALAVQGYKVLTAGDAKEALDVLEEHPEIDIVFSDIVMPGGMNGVKLAEVIRGRRPEIPIVLATGYSEEAGIPADIRTIAKPYEITTVVEALDQALARASTEKSAASR